MPYTDDDIRQMTPEQRQAAIQTIEGELARRKGAGRFNLRGATLGGLRTFMGESPEGRAPHEDLATFTEKERIRASFRPSATAKPKSIKEMAIESLGRGEPIEGLSLDETKKLAGIYIPPIKPSAAAEKRSSEEQKLSDELGGLLNSFTRAKEELATVSGVGEMGITGRFAGVGAKISGKGGYLPATNVYNAQRKAFATVVAKAAGEVRPTDEDIRRFVETLPDTGKSDEENALLISDIQDKVSMGQIGDLWKKPKAGQLRSGLTYTMTED